MTTNKLPDVVWIHHDYPWTFEDSEDNVFDGSVAYVRRALLDAMTESRNRAIELRNDARKERDSAREALAKATELLREAYELDALRDSDETLSDAARAYQEAAAKDGTHT